MSSFMKNGLVIAIDGPSGAGKSTAARTLAERLGYTYIDTGAMYRAVGWKAKQAGIDPADEKAMEQMCGKTEVVINTNRGGQHVFVDTTDVTDAIRTPEMGMMASAVSKSPSVRARLLTLQRQLGSRGGVVMDGRDIGTVVFPDADVKFYLDATPEERGRRRYAELRAKRLDVDLATITEEIRVRDGQDSSRAIAPLRKADDAFLIDSSAMTVDQVVDAMLSRVKEHVR
jgi:cytidylate kinase